MTAMKMYKPTDQVVLLQCLSAKSDLQLQNRMPILHNYNSRCKILQYSNSASLTKRILHKILDECSTKKDSIVTNSSTAHRLEQKHSYLSKINMCILTIFWDDLDLGIAIKSFYAFTTQSCKAGQNLSKTFSNPASTVFQFLFEMLITWRRLVSCGSKNKDGVYIQKCCRVISLLLVVQCSEELSSQCPPLVFALNRHPVPISKTVCTQMAASGHPIRDSKIALATRIVVFKSNYHWVLGSHGIFLCRGMEYERTEQKKMSAFLVSHVVRAWDTSTTTATTHCLVERIDHVIADNARPLSSHCPCWPVQLFLYDKELQPDCVLLHNILVLCKGLPILHRTVPLYF